MGTLVYKRPCIENTVSEVMLQSLVLKRRTYALCYHFSVRQGPLNFFVRGPHKLLHNSLGGGHLT